MSIEIPDEVVRTYQQIKVSKTLRFMTLKISNDSQKVEVEYTGSVGASYADFLKTLPWNEYRWGCFDFEYEQDGELRSKLIMLCWSPSEATIRQKMLYAASQYKVQKMMVGTGMELGAADLTDIPIERILEMLDRSLRR